MSRACAWFGLLLAAVLISASHADAAGVSWQIEGGLGSSWVPEPTPPSQPAASIYAAIGFPTRPVRITGEFGAAASFEPIGLSFIPESPVPGRRSLTTFLIGLEAGSARARGPFAMVGVGGGHATLSGAKPGMEQFPTGPPIPDRSVTDLAFGAGLGWRSTGGPGPLGFQFALRYHAVAHDGAIAGSATAVTFGLAY